jgi:8-oxo-dGTP pyrophosphatase MutT (NUDIX family)
VNSQSDSNDLHAAESDVLESVGPTDSMIGMGSGLGIPLLARLIDPGVEPAAPTLDRRAVRAVVRRDGELLMILSTRRGDYKFPGGGLDAGETDVDALARELAEECGARLTDIGAVVGDTLEYRASRMAGEPVLRMLSRYYACHVADDFGPQRLDDYEQQLGFLPIWVTPYEALVTNLAVIRDRDQGSGDPPPWTPREIFVLQHLGA